MSVGSVVGRALLQCHFFGLVPPDLTSLVSILLHYLMQSFSFLSGVSAAYCEMDSHEYCMPAVSNCL